MQSCKLFYLQVLMRCALNTGCSAPVIRNKDAQLDKTNSIRLGTGVIIFFLQSHAKKIKPFEYQPVFVHTKYVKTEKYKYIYVT